MWPGGETGRRWGLKMPWGKTRLGSIPSPATHNEIKITPDVIYVTVLAMSSDWLVDARHAARLVRRQPRFAAAAILLLATGIGAAAAVFTLVNAVVLVDMPFRDPDRLAWMYNARTERDRAPLSIPDLQDYRRDARTLEGLAPFTNWTANLTGRGDAERLEGIRVA